MTKITKQKQVCQIAGCNNEQHAKGLCNKHRMQILRYSRIQDRVYRDPICSVPGCDGKHKGKGYCLKHLRQVNKYGHIRTRTIHTPNIFTIKGAICEIVLFNNQSEKVGVTIIDAEDYEKCKDHKWYLHKHGYAESVINKKHVKLHQYVSLIKYTDHRDTDRLNNRKSNLRECNKAQNRQNAKRPTTNTSGIKNVTWNKEKKKWTVLLTANKVKYYIGDFDNIIEAETATTEARKKLHGNFAHNG